MGNFYASVAVGRVDNDQLFTTLSQVPDRGVIANAQDGWTVFSSELLETQDERIMDQYGEALSRGGAPVLGIINHDDDILMVFLYQNGVRAGFANTDPGALSGTDSPPIIQGGDEFAALREGVSVNEIQSLLTKNYIFAVDAHLALVDLLGLPRDSVGFGYSYFSRGEFGQDGFVTFGG